MLVPARCYFAFRSWTGIDILGFFILSDLTTLLLDCMEDSRLNFVVFSALFLLYNHKQTLPVHCARSFWLFVFFSLHEGYACLEQVRWIYAATELATSDPRRTKLVGRVNCRLEFWTLCCVAEDVPSPVPKTFKTSGKKSRLVPTPIFFQQSEQNDLHSN